MLTAAEIRERIAAFAATRPGAGEEPVAQVEVALFLEQVFGLQLADEEMTTDNLGSQQALEQFLLARLGVR